MEEKKVLLLVIVVFTQPLSQRVQEEKTQVRAHEEIAGMPDCRTTRRWPPAALT